MFNPSISQLDDDDNDSINLAADERPARQLPKRAKTDYNLSYAPDDDNDSMDLAADERPARLLPKRAKTDYNLSYAPDEPEYYYVDYTSQDTSA